MGATRYGNSKNKQLSHSDAMVFFAHTDPSAGSRGYGPCPTVNDPCRSLAIQSQCQETQICSRLFRCRYVCMYVCMYAFMYVCVYVYNACKVCKLYDVRMYV